MMIHNLTKAIIVTFLLMTDFSPSLLLSQSFAPLWIFNRRISTSHGAHFGETNTGILPLWKHKDDDNDNVQTTTTMPPYIAIITEPDACDTDERYDVTMRALYKAISTNHVDLISIRLSRNISTIGSSNMTISSNIDSNDEEEIQFKSRYIRMIQQLCEWSRHDYGSATTINGVPGHKKSFSVVVSSGPYMELGLRSYANGVHFKEMHRSQIPSTRQLYRSLRQHDDNTAAPESNSTPENNTTSTNDRNRIWRRNPELLVGTSVHSIPSAIDAYSTYQPDYMFVGTCYSTQSHPGKIELEGPELPSLVCDALNQCSSITTTSDQQSQQQKKHRTTIVLGIGGIDEINCRNVVKPDHHQQTTAQATTTTTTTTTGTCDGIAVIRSVLQSIDPAKTVSSMYEIMFHSLYTHPVDIKHDF